jgi:ABC-type uncharacterized transport system substrate-binding protein
LNGVREYVEAGGLLSYGPNWLSMWRRAADLVDKILRGAKPAEIPIEQPIEFDLVINLKTANALGLTIPDKLLALANAVIEWDGASSLGFSAARRPHGRSQPGRSRPSGCGASACSWDTPRAMCKLKLGSGFAASLARPGKNITGFANFENSIGGKWVELFKEIAPRAGRVGFVFNPDAAPNVGFFHAAEAAAPSLGIKLAALAVWDASDVEQAVAAFASEPDGGLIVAPHAVTLGNRKLLIELAARYRLPAVYSDRYFAESGGLASFGNNTADLFRRAATYIDLILKGANPAELPVQLPTKFKLIVNLKTAETLGLTISESFLTRADAVIEWAWILLRCVRSRTIWRNSSENLQRVSTRAEGRLQASHPICC